MRGAEVATAGVKQPFYQPVLRAFSLSGCARSGGWVWFGACITQF